MPILDANALFSDSQDLAKAAGSYLSDKSYDCSLPGSDVQGNTAPHDPGQTTVGIVARVVEAFATGTSVQAQLVSADDAALTSNLTVLQETDVIPTASLVLGYRFKITALPPGISKRYIGLRYVLAGASAFTTGKVTAGIVVTPQAA